MKLTLSFVGLYLVFLSLLLILAASLLGLGYFLAYPAAAAIALYIVALYHFLFESKAIRNQGH